MSYTVRLYAAKCTSATLTCVAYTFLSRWDEPETWLVMGAGMCFKFKVGIFTSDDLHFPVDWLNFINHPLEGIVGREQLCVSMFFCIFPDLYLHHFSCILCPNFCLNFRRCDQLHKLVRRCENSYILDPAQFCAYRCSPYLFDCPVSRCIRLFWRGGW